MCRGSWACKESVSAAGIVGHTYIYPINEIADFGQIVLVVAAGFTLALFGRAITDRFAIPSAALFLLAAAATADLVPRLSDAVSFVTVERIGVVALIVILLDGGMDIGWRRFRVAAVPSSPSACSAPSLRQA